MGFFDKLLGFLGGKSNPPAKPGALRVSPPQSPLTTPSAPPAKPPATAFNPTTGRAYTLGQTPSPPPATVNQPPARRAPEIKTLNLDASHFTPLTSSEIKSQLQGRGASSWEIFRGQGLAWWGNRSIIPPASDQRTQFIDRGMIGQGMVTAEELLEIHKVGDEMLRLKPQLDQAASIAEQAVRQSQQEKEALKQQKKAQQPVAKVPHSA